MKLKLRRRPPVMREGRDEALSHDRRRHCRRLFLRHPFLLPSPPVQISEIQQMENKIGFQEIA